MPKKKEQPKVEPKEVAQIAHPKKEAMLKALELCKGIVTDACKMLDAPRRTHYDWLESDPEYRKKVEDLDNAVLDFAENHLHKRIEEGSDAAIIFVLKTKGKKRGYIEKTQVENTHQFTAKQVFKIGNIEIEFNE